MDQSPNSLTPSNLREGRVEWDLVPLQEFSNSSGEIASIQALFRNAIQTMPSQESSSEIEKLLGSLDTHDPSLREAVEVAMDNFNMRVFSTRIESRMETMEQLLGKFEVALKKMAADLEDNDLLGQLKKDPNMDLGKLLNKIFERYMQIYKDSNKDLPKPNYNTFWSSPPDNLGGGYKKISFKAQIKFVSEESVPEKESCCCCTIS